MQIIETIKSEKFKAVLFLFPSLLLVGVFIISMMVNILYGSFFKWGTNLKIEKFNGFYNYITIFSDEVFHQVIVNNLLFLLSVPLAVLIPLIIAVLIYEKTPGWKIFKTLYLFPSVMSAIVVGILFTTIFSFEGPVNKLLEFAGLGFLSNNWLSMKGTAYFVIITAIIWAGFGKGTIIFLSALSTISDSVIEASIIDGAGWFQRLRKIILPMIAGVIEFYSVTCVIGVFTAMFGFIYVMTSGGPGYDTTVIEYFIYRMAFSPGRMGIANAMTVVTFIIMMLITITLTKIASRANDWSE